VACRIMSERSVLGSGSDRLVSGSEVFANLLEGVQCSRAAHGSAGAFTPPRPSFRKLMSRFRSMKADLRFDIAASGGGGRA
jgi:hypothetical protein